MVFSPTEGGAGSGWVIVGSDTAVVDGDQILGKPADDADAARMLRRIQSRYAAGPAEREHGQKIRGGAVHDPGLVPVDHVLSTPRSREGPYCGRV